MRPMIIPWRNELGFEDALQESKRVGKPVLVDFHEPSCNGCRRLVQTTYSSPIVIQTITEKSIPLRVITAGWDAASTAIINYYISISSPAVQLLSPGGTVYHCWRGAPRLTVLCARQIAQARRRVYVEADGYLSADLFLAQFLIARGKAALKEGRFDEAIRLLQDAPSGVDNDEETSAEARYWMSIVRQSPCQVA